ncbi:MAG TPA: hypothetical protein VGJ20_14015, partial [Xanthobacteraceae bacterium]
MTLTQMRYAGVKVTSHYPRATDASTITTSLPVPSAALSRTLEHIAILSTHLPHQTNPHSRVR